MTRTSHQPLSAPSGSHQHSRAALLLIAAVPLASVLSFAVQPMMGKRLLPIYGGSAGTWLGAMVFFQLALLIGYGWATWLLTRPPAFQRLATLVLAVIAIVSFRLPGLDGAAASGIGRIVWALSLNALPAMMLLFSVSPLVHGWLSREGDDVPYYIYALSNAGSLAGLIAYPFLIEPTIPIHQQRWIVHGGIVGVAALIAGAVVLMRKRVAASVSEPTSPPSRSALQEVTTTRQLVIWIGLSVLTCVCMLGATELLAAELGSNPLAWVGPFGAYLLSFTITFSGRWKPWMMVLAVFALVVSMTSFMFYKGPSSEPLAGLGLYTLLTSVTSACFVGNALLYRMRPAVRFDRYYLALATGGVIGGLLISLVLPQVFPRPIEFMVTGMILLLIGVLILVPKREFGAVAIAAALVLVPLTGIAYRRLLLEAPNATLKHYRNLYGHMFVRTTRARDQYRVELLSETTIHGTQLHVDAISTRRPTLYYSESTGAGRVLLQLRQTRPAMRIGVVGLGSGTLAAYARPTDEFRFWDVDPKAIEIAKNEFSYIADSLGATQVLMGDGRRGLAASTEDFDVIVIDAFSGDSVPAHLVTLEAMRIYLARLQARNGFLLIHTSSRYNAIYPVLSSTAQAAGRKSMDVLTMMEQRGQNIDWDPTDTEYVIIPPVDAYEQVQKWFPTEEENGRVKRQIVTNEGAQPEPSLVWTDERHAAIQAIDLKRFMFWRNP